MRLSPKFPGRFGAAKKKDLVVKQLFWKIEG
jgi:hypothetical protein